jgi:hypothetical protein
MTPEEHNKTLSTLHFVYGGLQVLMVLVMVGFLLFFAGLISNAPGGDGSEAVFIIGIMAVAVFFSLVFTIPSFVAGYGLSKRRHWAKLWGIIAGVVAGMSFPLGTALCVYSIWFLLGGCGREIYEESQTQPRRKRREALYGAPPPAGWAAPYASREREYAPPSEPPDWRS